jgi:HD-like signal output (HDOD) protein
MINQKKTASLVPRLPAVLPKLMQRLRAEDYNSSAITELISTDAVLAAELLRLVNSPYFSTTQKISDLDHAVTHVGQNGLRELMMAVAMKPIMQFDKGFFYKQAAKLTWEHSLKSAIACRNLAKSTGTDSFDAYLSGLMHNTGVMIVLRLLDQVPQMLEAPHSVIFQQRSEKFIARISHSITHHWELSDNVQLALKERSGSPRHRPSSSIGQMLELGVCLAQMHTLSAVGRHKKVEEDLKLLTRQPYGGNCTAVYGSLDRYQNKPD